MTFFACIGLITVAWLIYDLTKYIFIDYYKDLEEEQEAELEASVEEPFDEDGPEEEPAETINDVGNKVEKPIRISKPFNVNLTDENALYAPVFKTLPKVKGFEDVDEFNVYLKRIGAYARLYYHLIKVYGIPDIGSIKIKVYETEMMRRDILDRVYTTKPKTKLDNDEIDLIKTANSALHMVYANVQGTYNGIRKECLKNDHSAKWEQLGRISSVLNAENIHFESEPHWRDYYVRLTEPRLMKLGYELPKDYDLFIDHSPT